MVLQHIVRQVAIRQRIAQKPRMNVQKHQPQQQPGQ
jgi:hypothetical protein